jgi:hypothetical protein
VQLSYDGSVEISTQSPLDLVVDLNGAYMPVGSHVTAGRVLALDSSQRVADSRAGLPLAAGGSLRVDVGSVVPATAAAIVATVTTTDGAPGYWSVAAAGDARSESSTVNTDSPGQTRSNQCVVPIGTADGVRGIDVFSSSGGHVIVDVAAYVTGAGDAPGTDGLFVPNNPYRALDTRTDPRYGNLAPGWTAEFDYIGRASSRAVVVNLAVADTRGAGYFTGFPARTLRPNASNVNATMAGETVSSHAILRSSSAGVAVYTQSGGQMIVDVAGYYMGQPAPATLPRDPNVVPAH